MEIATMAERARRHTASRIPFAAAAAATALLIGFGCGKDGGSAQPASGSLRFVEQPPSIGVAFAKLDPDGAAGAITVEILDDAGVRIPGATDAVTLRIGDAGGYLILHATGIADPSPANYLGRRLELVDPAVPAVRHWLPKNWRLDAPTSLAYDPNTDEYLLTNRRINNFYRGDPRSGEATLVGDGITGGIAGMAWEMLDPGETGAATETGRLFAVVSKNAAPEDALYTINPATGVKDNLGLITPSEANLNFFSGLASDPVTGTLYATAAMNDNPTGGPYTGRILLEIDPNSEDLDATVIGDMLELNSDLAMGPDQQLYLVQTGKATPVPGAATRSPALMTVDTTLASIPPTTTVLELTSGPDEYTDGHAITVVPARLHGSVTVAAVDGVATFADLKIDAVGTGYTLVAEAAGRTAGTSESFDVSTPAVAPTYVVSFDVSGDTNVAETDATFDVTVELDAGPAITDIYVTAAVGGTAADQNDSSPDTDLDYLDYVQFVIAQGTSTATHTVTVVNDTEEEVPEDVIFTLKDASLAAGIGTEDNTIIFTLTSDEVPAVP